jgi:hypothetical protein
MKFWKHIVITLITLFSISTRESVISHEHKLVHATTKSVSHHSNQHALKLLSVVDSQTNASLENIESDDTDDIQEVKASIAHEIEAISIFICHCQKHWLHS